MDVLTTEREKLLASAASLFERYGYKKTTIEDIARDSGIGKGSVYLRFSSKAEIAIACIRQVGDRWWAEISVPEKQGPSDQVVEFLTRRILVRFNDFDRYRQTWEECYDALSADIREIAVEIQEREARHLKSIIRTGIEAGEFTSIDPLGDARIMILASNSLIPYRRKVDDNYDRRTIEEHATALANLLVRALRRAPADATRN
ncbi:MAG: TetR/AcrR family transcriptional regulator [Armatimonadetes bacterium]|nr:TetR/AcrR family transcriptional regulator [Armatimonadota bacterium]